MGMRMYEGNKAYWGVFQVAIVDVEGRGIGFDEKYRLVVLLNGTRKAYPIRVGSVLAPSYVMEKFDMNEVTAEGFIEFLMKLPKGELDVKWSFRRETDRTHEDYPWIIRKLN